MQNVLVCDDDEAILESLRIYLDNAGFNVITAVDGQDALEKVQNNEIHCVVLDIMMPRLDGLKATLKIREKYNFPIILLSAKSEDTDKITGLGFGADDYVTKPFNPLELVARVKSQIRRYVNLGSMVATPTRLVTGGLVLDTDAKSLSVDDEAVKEAVWNEPSFTSEKTVTVHIRNIREKIEINPKEPKYIKVVYGLGYKCEKI